MSQHVHFLWNSRIEFFGRIIKFEHINRRQRSYQLSDIGLSLPQRVHDVPQHVRVIAMTYSNPYSTPQIPYP